MRVLYQSLPSWDIVVFLTITGIGFGFSIQRLDHVVMPIEDPNMNTEEGTMVTRFDSRQVIDLGCLESRAGRSRLSSHSGAVRLKGRFCYLPVRAVKDFEGLRVRNISTGYDGMVFFRGGGTAFISDALDLQLGKNLIQLEWREALTGDSKECIAEIFQR